AQHARSLEAWFAHVAGLKVVMPATPADAKGLLTASIRDDDPVIFLEHKLLYRTKGEVPTGEHVVPLGSADVKRAGKDLTIVSWSRAVLETPIPYAQHLEKTVVPQVDDIVRVAKELVA